VLAFSPVLSSFIHIEIFLFSLYFWKHRMGCALHDHGHGHGHSHTASSEKKHSHEPHSEVSESNHQHNRQNMNVRAAMIHVISDFVQSCGVFLAAVVIYFKPEWSIIDPICTFLFSILVLFTTLNIMRDAILVSVFIELQKRVENSKLVCKVFEDFKLIGKFRMQTQKMKK
jgi:cation diffusion facilitator family transporter